MVRFCCQHFLSHDNYSIKIPSKYIVMRDLPSFGDIEKLKKKGKYKYLYIK